MLQQLKLLLAPGAWRLLCAVTRLEKLPEAYLTQGGPLILSCLHRDILPAIMHVKPARPALLVSHSPDGDILIRTLGEKSYRFVRGATGDDGTRAFKGLVRQLEQGHSVGLAVDGPKGPFGSIQEGVLQLARLTGAPILPLVARPRRAWVLGTWDRTVVPVPFSRVEFRHGPLLTVPRDAGRAELQGMKDQLADFFGVREVAS
jgi:lysophospholipid acyltransferase (LPLAT)-like uncharacterized protein